MKRIKILALFVIIVLLIAIVIIVLERHKMFKNKAEKEFKAIFQVIEFNVPQNKYVLLDIIPSNGDVQLMATFTGEELYTKYGIPPDTKNEEKEGVNKDITTIIRLENEKISFDLNNIVKTDHQGKFPKTKKNKGLTTEAGRLDKEWGFFCAKKNEYMMARLYFLRFKDLKVIKTKQETPGYRLIKVLKV